MTDLPSSFDSAWEVADDVEGWLTKEQGQMLWNAAVELTPGATVLEIGSHKGRSTVVLASAVKKEGGRVVAVDPFVDGRLFGGRSTRAVFESTLRRAGVDGVVDLRCEYSTRLRPSWGDAIDLLYIDGKHDYWTVRDDLQWAAHVPPGASVLVHDCFSSVGVTLAILIHVLPGSELTYRGRAGSMARFDRRRPTWGDRARLVAQLPWWVRNVGIKLLLRLHLRRLAALFGHPGPYDPY